MRDRLDIERAQKEYAQWQRAGILGSRMDKELIPALLTELAAARKVVAAAETLDGWMRKDRNPMRVETRLEARALRTALATYREVAS